MIVFFFFKEERSRFRKELVLIITYGGQGRGNQQRLQDLCKGTIVQNLLCLDTVGRARGKTTFPEQREACPFHRDGEKAGELGGKSQRTSVVKVLWSSCPLVVRVFEARGVNFQVSLAVPRCPRTSKVPCPVLFPFLCWPVTSLNAELRSLQRAVLLWIRGWALGSQGGLKP